MNITVRKAQVKDDFDEIAKLLIIADPYVYPPWFGGDEALCIRGLSHLIANSEVFSYRNTYLAFSDNGEVAGALLYIKKGTVWDPEAGKAMLRNLAREPDDAFLQTEQQYLNVIVRFASDRYLLNLSTFIRFRRMGIAQLLMQTFLKEMRGFSVILEVVNTEESMPAMALYEKFNFRITDSYPTFCLYRNDLVSNHMRLDQENNTSMDQLH
jgi:ribosomal protein S18 acetylase RimI-like enzyme